MERHSPFSPLPLEGAVERSETGLVARLLKIRFLRVVIPRKQHLYAASFCFRASFIGLQGGFLDFARNDSVGNGYLVHHAKKECVGNAFFSYRHPERSPRSFSLAVRRRVSDSREWETPYRRKGGTVLPVNGIAKESWKRGTKKISRCLK